MKVRLKNALALAATATLALGGLAACGDDDSSEEGSSTAALSSEDLVSQGDQICKEHADAINSAVVEISKGGEPAAVDVRVTTKEVVLPQYSAQIGQLGALEPPEDLSTQWDTWLTDSTATRDAIKDDPEIIFDGSQFEAVNTQAKELGLGQDCLAGPTSA